MSEAKISELLEKQKTFETQISEILEQQKTIKDDISTLKSTVESRLLPGCMGIMGEVNTVEAANKDLKQRVAQLENIIQQQKL